MFLGPGRFKYLLVLVNTFHGWIDHSHDEVKGTMKQ